MRRDERRGHKEKRHHCPTVRSKPHEAKETREGEELPDGCRRRVCRRVRHRNRTGKERGREQRETGVTGHPVSDEKHRQDRQGTEDGDEQVDRRRHIEPAEVNESRLGEEHAREIRIGDAPSVVGRREMIAPDERSQDRKVLARVGAPVEKRPKRQEPHRDRDERDRGQRDGVRLPHSLANRPPLLKGLRETRSRANQRLFEKRRSRFRGGVGAVFVEVIEREDARCLLDCIPRRAKNIYPPVVQKDVEVPFPFERIERERADQGLEPSRKMPSTAQPPNEYLTEISAKPEHGTLVSSLFSPNGVPETLAEETVDDLKIFWPVL